MKSSIPLWKKISCALLPLQFVLFRVFSSNTFWVETYYSRSIFIKITKFLRIFTAPLPFSIGLIFTYFLALFLSIFIVKTVFSFIKKRKKIQIIFINLFAILSPIYFYFMITWGLAYHKIPLDSLLQLNRNNIQDEEIISLCKDLIKETNSSRQLIDNKEIKLISLKNILKETPSNFEIIKNKLPYLSLKNPSLKPAFGSSIMAALNTSGMYFFPTAEATINTINTPLTSPFVACHEYSHQLGFASEDEANYLAYWACKKSKNPLFNYSGNFNIVFRALYKVSEIDSVLAKQLYSQLDKKVLQDVAWNKKHWEKYENQFIGRISAIFYDFFLRSNGIKEGTRSYDLVIELLIAERRKKKIDLE